jgi:transposase, IS30 family
MQRELGISRSIARIWKNGTTVRLKDGSVKVVPPLEPSSTRVISPRFLSEDERVRIADLAAEGLGPTVIGAHLGRSASTISRELRRNLHPSGQYRPFHAHAAAPTRRRRPRPDKLSLSKELDAFVRDKLRQRWSPQQISRALRVQHPDDPGMRICAESLYQALYRPGSDLLRRSEPSPLRTGRDHRRGHTRHVRSRRRFAAPMVSVHDRGFDTDDRSQAGRWEGDLIVGPNHRSGIGTLVERQTRYVKLLHLPVQDSATLLLSRLWECCRLRCVAA